MQRLLALDVMRGLTVALMIMVNMPGSWSYIYPPLRHASWHGCTPTDLVFPFFLFIVGSAMAYSFGKSRENKTKGALVRKVIKRMFLIFLIGLLLHLFPKFHFENMRIMGVLQRIALAYGFAGLIVIYMKSKHIYIISVFILLGYWGLLFLGGNPPYEAKTTIVTIVDKAVLGENHLWRGLGFPFDPEGLLSTIPSIVTVLMGYLAGQLIRLTSRVKISVVRLLILGLTAALLGWIWGLYFPINKSLWTSSYVLYTGGLAMLLLALLLWLIDVLGLRKWAAPAIHFGLNPLFIFVFSGIYVRILYMIKIPIDGKIVNGYKYLYEYIFVPLAGNMQGSLLFAISHLFLFWLLVYFLYRKRILIKI